MPIKLGNTNISTIYKGTTPISAIYKGTTLLYQSASWELYSKVYFYNELVPTTINGKNVLNKAKIVKISGNGVIENQLANPTPPTQTINGVTFTNNGDGSWTVNGTATANTVKTVSSVFQTISGHYYLICGCANGGSNSTYRLLEGYTYRWADIGNGYIQQASSSGNASLIIEVKSGITCNNLIFKPQFKDLTLREGTGNEPTSLTDNRIQNILNRGYIPFNLGKYKESDIGVVSSEPYNLFDGEYLTGYYDGSNGIYNSSPNQLCSKNYISVVAGESYSCDLGNNSTYWRVCWYDKNKTFISSTAQTGGSSVQAPNNSYFAQFGFGSVYGGTYNNDVCFHITGTRTGYAEHKTFTPVTFKAQLGGAINSHNTMEITNSAYVFTRNQWKVDMGSIAWEYAGANIFYKDISNIKNTADNTLGDIITPIYTSVKRNDLGDKNICISGTSIITKDSAYTNASVYKTAMSGTYAYYPLATPQVISIPKKHLGIKRIRDLSWGYTTANGHSVFYTTGVRNGNNYSVYCSLYLYDAGTIANNQIRNDTYFGPNYLYITDDRYTSTTDFLNECGDYLIFYETENEVADITDVIDIESGGTITTDSEVLPNIELSVKCK